jgi:hypothetical protein
MSFLLLVHRLLCFVRDHTWTTVAAGHPLQQCIYCERVLEVALLTVLVVAGLSALALAAAGYLEEAHPDEGGPTARVEGVKSPQEIAPEKQTASAFQVSRAGEPLPGTDACLSVSSSELTYDPTHVPLRPLLPLPSRATLTPPRSDS